MSDRSSIEWTDASWNPATGCSQVSPGCAHCYAETFAERFRGVPGHPYEQGFDLKLWPERLSSLRRELDTYLRFYNNDRVHHGRLTRGRIPADIVYRARKMEAQ